jgi:hypothetical protein
MTVDLRADPHPAHTTVAMIMGTDWAEKERQLQDILTLAHDRLEEASTVIGSFYSKDRETIG